LPLLLLSAANAPARKLPSPSLKVMEATLGRLTTPSTMANWVLGNCLATCSSAEACAKPIEMMGEAPFSAMRRSACTRWVSLEISNSR
jgi:hypothetical protein